MDLTTVRSVILAIVFLAIATPASAVSLDTEGQGCYCIYNCTVSSVMLKTYTTKKSIYDLDAVCRYTPASNCAACPPEPEPVKGTLEWIRENNLNIATEIFSRNGHTYANTTSKCSQNPWTNDSVACNLVIRNFQNTAFNVFTGPYPISALLMTSAQKQSLKQKEAQTTPIIIAPPAPQILLPARNKVFFAPAKVAIKVKHDPVHTVIFEFKWRSKKPQPGEWPEGYTTVEGIVPDNVVRSNGITTAELTIGKTGQWMLRTRANFPGAQWSEVEFEVQKLQQNFQQMKKPLIPLKKLP